LLAFLLSDRFDGWRLYAHNGSGYDFLFLLPLLIREGIKFEAYKTGGRIFLNVGDHVFLDSMCILKGSLRLVAKSLGVSTQKWSNLPDDFYQNIERYDWRPYMKDDCICLWQCIHVLQTAFSLLGADLKPTLASTALSLFQTHYLSDRIPILPWNDEHEKCARMAYVGGRNDIFKSHMRSGACWDINSSYPYAMLSDVPTSLVRDGLSDRIPDFGIAHARVSVPHTDYIPPLHFRKDCTLYFPTGDLIGWYTTKELEFCRNRYGRNSIKIDHFIEYKPAPIFRQFVLDLYARRLQAKADKNAIMSEACKLLMNSLSGKMGMSRDRELIVNGPEYVGYPWNNPQALQQLREHHGKELKKENCFCTEYSREHFVYGIPNYVERAPYIFPQVIAWITADARIRLQSFLDISGARCCYCDTDSVYAECEIGQDPYTQYEGKELGQLKKEDDIAWAHFSSPKVYLKAVRKSDVPLHLSFGNVVYKGAAKGLPRETLSSVTDYIAGKSIKYPHVRGAIETLRKYGNVRVESIWATKRPQFLRTKRHLDGRAWRIEEIQS